MVPVWYVSPATYSFNKFEQDVLTGVIFALY